MKKSLPTSGQSPASEEEVFSSRLRMLSPFPLHGASFLLQTPAATQRLEKHPPPKQGADSLTPGHMDFVKYAKDTSVSTESHRDPNRELATLEM